ncbi:putative transmembrane protein [Bacillus subtilis]|nr:putative transmembrane protein [Bacillus subtilis]
MSLKWSKLYLDDSQAGWTMPNREEGFYRAWQHLIQYDPALSKKQRERVKGWPKEAHLALQEALFALEIPESEIQTYLEGHLLSLPGWAGMMLWRSQQSSHEHALLTEYLAVRISMEWALIKPYLPLTNERSKKTISIAPLIAAWIHWGGLTLEEWSQMTASEQNEYLSFAYSFDEKLRKKLWLEAWEQTYTDRLSQKIISKQRETGREKSALAQLAFCIDVRSEPFRRQLEKEGPFETIGIAGFFGVPIATCELGSKHSHASLPIIQKPQNKIKEFADEDVFKKYNQRKQAIHSLSHTFKTMKQNALSSLLLPELSGPWLTLQMAARSFVPRKAGRFIRNLREAWLRKPDTKLSLHHDATEAEIPVGFTDEEKVNYARQALKMMGLTENIAPLVVICGHGSQSTNNPYSAALDCGACGGAAGGFNARVLAALCNLSEVREALLAEGIKIPEDTVFAAAEHNTTVDELHWLYVPELSEAAQEAFEQIEAVMPKVRHHVNAERLAQLPNFQSKLKNPKAEANRFAEDWSEIRPEWGLARNAAFIIGKRELTQDCDLEGRAFLHNYDWKQDESGELLANIIVGPGTVAQWINLQYYASTVAPHYYGSGNKATQTVTAGLGVMQGNASDLLAGLPWQSVMESDHEAYHSPLRLLILIQAPREYVERLLNHDSAFLQKVQNGWVRLASLDPEGCWESW